MSESEKNVNTENILSAEIMDDDMREKLCHDNFNRMRTVKSYFRTCRIYNVFFNLLVIYVSVVGVYLWISYTQAGIKFAASMDMERPVLYAPGFAVTFFCTPAITVMTYFADTFLIKRLNVICRWIYIGILAFAVSNLIFGYEPMKWQHLFLLILYAGFGAWSEDFAVRSYNELDFLAGQEGFPDFNYMIEQGNHSKYVKYREKWLKTEKKQDYYTDSERPIQDYNVTAPVKENEMDGISVEAEKCEGWFEGKTTEAPDKQGDGMDILETDGAGVCSEEEYIASDPRRRPL